MKKFLKTKNLSNLKILTVAALFSALSIVLGKFLAINIGNTVRISLENLPIIFSGILFGPAVGAVTGFSADFIGSILRGYAINPIITLAATLIGFLSGWLYSVFKKFKQTSRIFICVLLCHTICSVFIKTAGLCIWYGSPFFITFFWRTISYLIITFAEFLILKILINSKPLINLLGVNNEL